MNKKHPLYKEDLDNILKVDNINELKGKSVLITGATGLIGVCMIDALMKLGDVKIYAVGRNKDKASARLGEYFGNPMFKFVEQDVMMPFPEDMKVDFIIPAASNTHPLAYSQFPIETMLINIKGAEHALELAVRCNATVLYPSSVEIYGNAHGQDVFTEEYTGKLNLSTSRACYTESKRSSEALCQSYVAERGANVKIARLSRVFGPTMLESDSKASSQFIKKAIAGEDIVLKSKGEQFFSYTYVADAVAAMIHIMLNGENGVVYNIAAEDCNVHLKDFAQICAEASGKNVVFDLPSETEMKGFSIATQAILDNSRLISSGWKPKYSMKDAVNRTINIIK
ncbi:MAG: NAD-dependent epimerase/dehydratase family protein [Bacteroidaceae bacterium]|nr:NAD-dependent epimerase/dehydratase family protein [Bacteroidaceae bacterium]